jgi:hypothetical protein
MLFHFDCIFSTLYFRASYNFAASFFLSFSRSLPGGTWYVGCFTAFICRISSTFLNFAFGLGRAAELSSFSAEEAAEPPAAIKEAEVMVVAGGGFQRSLMFNLPGRNRSAEEEHEHKSCCHV